MFWWFSCCLLADPPEDVSGVFSMGFLVFREYFIVFACFEGSDVVYAGAGGDF